MVASHQRLNDPAESETESLLGLVMEIGKGLPLSTLDEVVARVAPDDNSFAYRLVPRATLARRRKGFGEAEQARLTPDEGAKVARLQRVWTLAHEVWGSEDEARAFLFRPHMLLEMHRPIDVVLANEFGGPLVENILGGLHYGSAV